MVRLSPPPQDNFEGNIVMCLSRETMRSVASHAVLVAQKGKKTDPCGNEILP